MVGRAFVMMSLGLVTVMFLELFGNPDLSMLTNINASGMVTTRNVTTIVALADEAIFFVGEYYPARVDAICTGKKNTELARLC